MNSIKTATTEFPILEIIKNRWSARAFSDKTISEEQLNTLFEAASWAASANNEQPWEYVYAQKSSEGFDKIWNCLAGGNQPWAKNADTLVVAMARKTYQANGKDNAWAQHDLGMANAHLFLQAISMEIYCHPMAGFDKDKIIDTLQLDNHQEPICVIALGFLADAETLEEPFRGRELTARKRKALTDFTTKL